MTTKSRFMFVIVSLLIVLSAIEVHTASAGAPYVPNWFNISDNVSLANSYVSLCAASQGDPEGDDFQVRIEIFSAPIPDIQSDWMWAAQGYAVCWHSGYGLPNGVYHWQARAKDVHGEESAASPVMTFTVAYVEETTDYTFSINRAGYTVQLEKAQNSCYIKDGHELVVAEINRVTPYLGGLNPALRVAEFIAYFLPYPAQIGFVEELREEVESWLPGCTTVYYRIGNSQTGYSFMDSSGLGNIAYGYLLSRYGISTDFQNYSAAVDQDLRDRFGLGVLVTYSSCGYNFHCMMTSDTVLRDNPDDFVQRLVGESLASISPLDIGSLVFAANTIGLY